MPKWKVYFYAKMYFMFMGELLSTKTRYEENKYVVSYTCVKIPGDLCVDRQSRQIGERLRIYLLLFFFYVLFSSNFWLCSASPWAFLIEVTGRSSERRTCSASLKPFRCFL